MTSKKLFSNDLFYVIKNLLKKSRYVTKLNGKVKIGFYEANWRSDPEPLAQPVIRLTVEAENPKNANLTGNFFESILPMNRPNVAQSMFN